MRTKHVIFFQLLWVLFFGFVFVLIIQSLAAKLGVITGETILTIKLVLQMLSHYYKNGL